MSANTITITTEALADLIASAVTRGVTAALAAQPIRDESAERRRAADRERKAKARRLPQTSADIPQTSTESADFPSPSPSPSLPPSPLSPAPPLPAPSHTPPSAPPPPRASTRGGWQESNRLEAEKASAVEIPTEIDTPEFRQAWARWAEYRTGRATTVLKSQAIPWTVAGAQAALRQCVSYAKSLGLAAIIDRIDSAIAGQWQGINLDKVTPPGRGGSARPAAHVSNHAATTAHMAERQRREAEQRRISAEDTTPPEERL